MKKSFFCFLFLTIACQSFGQSPFQSVKNRANDVSLLYFQDETEGMVRIQPIYSKARGMTVLSAINNVNNRALRKLKIEAAMLGADGLYITNNYQKGVQFLAPVQVTYSAVAYRETQLTVEGVKAMYSDKSYRSRSRVIYNRNSFSEKIKFLSDPNKELNFTNIIEERGYIWVDITYNNRRQRYRVVRADENQIILSRYVEKDKIIESLEFVNAALFKNY